MIPAITFLILLAIIPLADRLAQYLAVGLNAEWRDTALAWINAVQVDDTTVDALTDMPDVPVTDLGRVTVWGTAGTLAGLGAIWVGFGALPWQGAGFLGLLTTGLMVAVLVDLRIQLLPDAVLFPLAALGLVACLLGHGVSPATALGGALAGGGGLWLVSFGFSSIKGQEGLGFGDVKLVALAGLWVGWQPLPWLLLGASVGAIIGHLIFYGNSTERRIAFGPALAVMFLASGAFFTT